MGLHHVLEEKAGKSICCRSLVPTWAMSTPTAGAGSARHLGNWEFVNPQTPDEFPQQKQQLGLRTGSLDNQTTKQVLAVDTNCQNFTGKEKNQRNVNLGPQSVPRKQNHPWGKKERKGKKEKK